MRNQPIRGLKVATLAQLRLYEISPQAKVEACEHTMLYKFELRANQKLNVENILICELCYRVHHSEDT